MASESLAPTALARRMARRTVKTAALVADRGRPGRGPAILIYHRIGAGTGSEIDLPVADFRAQLDHLRSHDRAVTLDEALAATAPRALGDPVALTFDDGTADFLDHALPELERFGVPALLYLATSFCDEQRDFDGHQPVSWAGLRDALSTGLITIGSHTHRHRLLDRLPEDEVAVELDRSIELIEDHLGVSPRHFAYPKAVAPTSAAARAVAARFDTAALAGTRSNPYGRIDRHALQRSPVQTSDAMMGFAAKCNGGMGFEDRLRSAIHTVSYRGLTT